MVSFDSGRTLAERFRAHAGDRSHLYGYAMRAMADDWETGGPVREVCQGHEDAPAGSVIQLRLLAGIFRVVLSGRADELEPYYPCLGGTSDPAYAWPVMRAVIAAHVEELHDALRIAPQTNEVGRSAALLVGLWDVLERTGAQRIRLLELGASAGLNLLLDRFAYTGEGWAFGPPDSALRLVEAVQGRVRPRPVVLAERRGCDLHPIDPSTPSGRELLTSFVWPFDLHRHERLRAAFDVVATTGAATVDAAGAADWLPARLVAETHDSLTDDLTVVWRSITQQYWPASEIEQVAALLDAYGSTHRLATVSLEYAPESSPDGRPVISTQVWDGDGTPARAQAIGTAHDHGIPVQLVDSAPAESA